MPPPCRYSIHSVSRGGETEVRGIRGLGGQESALLPYIGLLRNYSNPGPHPYPKAPLATGAMLTQQPRPAQVHWSRLARG